MKVLRIVPYLDFGGVEQVIANSVPFFIESSKMEVMIIVLGDGGRVEKELVKKGVNVILLNQNTRIPNFMIIFKLFNSIKSFKPDVVHCQAAEANFHGLIAARMACVPVRIGEEIGFPNHHSYWKYIFRLVYKNATKVIAISQAVKSRIVELGEVEAEKVEVVYNPVELGDREKRLWSSSLDFSLRASVRNDNEKPFSISEAVSDGIESEERKPFVFVTICRLVPVKNLNTLIKVFAEIVEENQDREMKLWIVGDGPERENLKDLVKKLGIYENVNFWGFQEEVVTFLEQADAFVLPSISEGFSISLVEAMLCGLPCVVTNQGGPSEIVEEGKTGFLINPYQADDLKSKMLGVLKLSNDQKQLIGENAQEVGRKYSVESYVKRLMEVYSTP
jgi:glycosyltransferase involved in cell wall biosynthesis